VPRSPDTPTPLHNMHERLLADKRKRKNTCGMARGDTRAGARRCRACESLELRLTRS
jgi:hypothetical protein